MHEAAVANFSELFQEDIDIEYSPHQQYSIPGLPGLEPQLHVQYAAIIASLDKEMNDDPEYACYSCERLQQRKNITSMKGHTNKFVSAVTVCGNN